MKRWCKTLAVTVGLSVGLSAMAFAQGNNYPNKPIKLIVPWGAGSGIDVQVRQFADVFGRTLGTPVVVENKPGAGSQIGYEMASRAAPDGYTLLAGTNANFIHQHLQPQANIDPVRDMAPISMMFWMPSVLVVAKESPAKDVPSFLSWVKTFPSGANYGSGGVGSASHLLAAMISNRNQLDVTHIPLRTLTADLGPMLTKGDIQFALPVTGVASVQISQGNVKPLAVTSTKRLPQWPDVPTLAEVFKDPAYEADSWTALLAPKGTPEDVLERLRAATEEAIQSEQHQRAAKHLHTIPAFSVTRSEFMAFLRSEAGKWQRIAADSQMSKN